MACACTCMKCLRGCGIGCSPLWHGGNICNQEASRRRRGGASGVWNLLAAIDRGMTDTCKIHSSIQEGDNSLSVTQNTLSDTTEGLPLLLGKKQKQSEVRLSYAGERKVWTTSTYRLFWCVWNAKSIIKAEACVCSVPRAEQQRRYAVMETHSLETGSIYMLYIYGLALAM